ALKGGLVMRRQFKIVLICAFTAVQPALAQNGKLAVPLEKSGYHVPVFSNEFLNVLRVHVPSKRTAFHNIVITFPETRPRRFAPAPREVVGYTQVLDNERIRAWRLVLEPGQSAGLISQQAPGMRVIVQGGEIVESVPGECERGMLLRLGDFYWQE